LSKFRSTTRPARPTQPHYDRIANDQLLCTVTGYPNALGIIEPLGAISERTHRAGALAISATAEGIALGLLRAPVNLASISQSARDKSFGLPLQYGGPGVGFMAARTAHLRQMPGRLVGQTRDIATVAAHFA